MYWKGGGTVKLGDWDTQCFVMKWPLYKNLIIREQNKFLKMGYCLLTCWTYQGHSSSLLWLPEVISGVTQAFSCENGGEQTITTILEANLAIPMELFQTRKYLCSRISGPGKSPLLISWFKKTKYICRSVLYWITCKNKLWTQPTCLPREDWINKLEDIHMMGYCAVIVH